MKRLLLLVEGQTEETFVRDVLGPHLASKNIASQAVILATKRVKSGGKFRGGVVSTQQVLREVQLLLNDTGASAVTTVLDYYGLPEDFPGMDTRPRADPHQRVRHVEAALERVVSRSRFIPHLVLHEYEAWIYSDPKRCEWVLEPTGIADKLIAIRESAGGPERIDDGPTTAPSKRLLRLWPSYQKTLHGPMAVGAIGLDVLRSTCPHAHAWMNVLEGL